MNVEATHQNNALSRQCSEAIRIKEVEPKQRINNKEEYHQPGDIEISYAKNDNMEKHKKKIQNTENTSSRENNSDDNNINTNQEADSLQSKITQFFNNIRNDLNKETEKSIMIEEEEELQPNTQEMITDARVRRTLKKNGSSESQKCEQCDFTTTSSTLLKRHCDRIHRNDENDIEMRPRYNCEKCQFKTTSEYVLQKHTKMNHENQKKIVSSKSKICGKKFNKNETFMTHMKTIHKSNV